MRSLVAAPVTLLALAISGCAGGSDEEARSTPSATSVVDEGLDHCELLDEAERDELAGTSLLIVTSTSVYPEGGCTWADDASNRSTVELHMTGMRSQVWARDLDSILEDLLSAPEDADEYKALQDTEEERSTLDAEQACGLWAKVNTQYRSEPDGDVMLHTFSDTSEGVDGPEEVHLARAEICRDGVFAEVDVISYDPISEEREKLVRTQVETVWERVRDALPAEDA